MNDTNYTLSFREKLSGWRAATFLFLFLRRLNRKVKRILEDNRPIFAINMTSIHWVLLHCPLLWGRSIWMTSAETANVDKKYQKSPAHVKFDCSCREFRLEARGRWATIPVEAVCIFVCWPNGKGKKLETGHLGRYSFRAIGDPNPFLDAKSGWYLYLFSFFL